MVMLIPIMPSLAAMRAYSAPAPKWLLLTTPTAPTPCSRASLMASSMAARPAINPAAASASITRSVLFPRTKRMWGCTWMAPLRIRA